MSSSSSTEVAGFRLEGELGSGRSAVVYEAVQVSLGRRVALKLFAAGDGPAGPSLEWPDHPRVVSLYATGPWGQGRFVAMQLVAGPSLAQVIERGGLSGDLRLALLDDVATALDAAHRAGIAHGRVSARNVLIDGDGHALLSDFGLAAGEPTVAGDRADFAALVRECLGEDVPLPPDPRTLEAGETVRHARGALPARRRRSPRLVAASAILAAAMVAVVAILLLAGRDDQPDPVPRPERGAQALGSDLAGGGAGSVDCSGRPPSGGSQACTVAQTRLPGRRVVPRAGGVIRRWVVRGARGELALQVIHGRGDRYVSTERSRYEQVPDEGVHVLPANLAVRPGDRIGVQLAPGAAIGVRRGVPGATTARWLGQLFLEPRPVELGPGTGFDHEILLRADYTPGAQPRPAGGLTGRAARRAPAGRELVSRTVEVRGSLRRVAVVKVAGTVAVDLFAGDRRLARVPAPDADPRGRPLNFATFGLQYPILRWRNPDGRTISHEYAVGAGTLTVRR